MKWQPAVLLLCVTLLSAAVVGAAKSKETALVWRDMRKHSGVDDECQADSSGSVAALSKRLHNDGLYSTRLGLPEDRRLAFVATFEDIHAIDLDEPEPLLWTMHVGPIITGTPQNVTDRNTWIFLDPRDGHIYTSAAGAGIQRLNYDVRELVDKAPFIEERGNVFTGSASKVLHAVDPLTGQVKQTFRQPTGKDSDLFKTTYYGADVPGSGSAAEDNEGPAHLMFLGRTEYSLTVSHVHSGDVRFNATVAQYANPHLNPSQELIDVMGFDHGNRFVVANDTLRFGSPGDWTVRVNLNSPIVSIYLLEGTGSLVKVPSEHVVYVRSLPSFASDTPTSVHPAKGDRLVEIHGSSDGIFYTMGVNHLIGGASPELGLLEAEFRQDGSDLLIAGEDTNHALISAASAGSTGEPAQSTALSIPSQFDWQQTFAPNIFVVKEPKKRRLRPDSDQVAIPSNQLKDRSETRPVLRGSNTVTVVASIIVAIASLGFAWTVWKGSQRRVAHEPNMPSKRDDTKLQEINHDMPRNDPSASLNASAGNASDTRIDSINSSTMVRELDDSVTAQKQLEPGEIAVGRLILCEETVLGHGSHGTIVYKGKFEGCPVAVKRMLKAKFSAASKEVDLLRRSDYHQNVVRYYCMEEDTRFMYIGLELCLGTLVQVVEGPIVSERGTHHGVDLDIARVKALDRRQLCWEMLNGLSHLHALDIVHRDIKPHNVLLSQQYRAVISDFGLCAELDEGQSSYNTTQLGTTGWRAPEVLLRGRTTKAVDMFSAGCVVHYVMHGKHPFGMPWERESRIRKGKLRLKKAKDKCLDDLLQCMLTFEPEDRITAREALAHPYFWPAKRKLSFLMDVSDRVEKEEETSPVVQQLEDNASKVVFNDWRTAISDELLQDLAKRRSYRYTSVIHLLRAARNKKHHYQELSDDLKKSLGSLPDGFFHYFDERFPYLFTHVYNVVKHSALRHEPMFEHYFQVEALP